MGENTNEIEHEIDAERTELGRNLEELEQKARDLADWRTHYRNHPAVFLGAAVSAGVLLGALSGGTSRPRPRRMAGLMSQSDQSEETETRPSAPEPRPFKTQHARGPKTRELFNTWEHISEALLGVAIAKIIDVVSDAIPGFRDQYDVHASRPSPAYSHAGAGESGTRIHREPDR